MQNKRKSRPRARSLAASLACCGLLPLAAGAQQRPEEDLSRTLTLFATSNTLYDSNLFHLPDSADTQALLGNSDESDFIQTAAVGLRLDKSIGQQQFVGEASFAHNWYKNYDFLDGNATNFDLAWHWHLTPRIGGSITANRREVPADYDYYQDYGRRNYVTLQDYRFRLNANPFGGWNLIAGAGTAAASNTVSTGETPKSSQYYFDGGLAYVSRAGSRLQAVWRHAEGKYSSSNTSQFATARDFTEETGQISLFTPSENILSFKLSAGYTSREHEAFTERDFDGFIADARIIWKATDRVELSLIGKRLLSPFQDAYFTYYCRQDLSFVPKWALSPKLSFGASVGITNNDFDGQSNPAAPPPGREDKLWAWSVDATWTPYRFLTLKTAAGSRNRNSDFDAQDLDYTSTTASFSVALAF